MGEQTDDAPEFPWVARLREAGIEVRTGRGPLSRDPADSFSAPPGLRSAITRVLRNFWNGPVHRLTHPKRHASVP